MRIICRQPLTPSSVGDYLIYDPGSPPSNVSCNTVANGEVPSICHPLASPNHLITSGPNEPGVVTSISNNGPSAMVTATYSSSSSAMETSSSSELNSTLSGAGLAPSASTGLTEGSKAAIGICASLAIIAIIFLVGFLISRRRSRPQSYFDGAPNAPRHGRSFSEPASGSRTPLITPPPSASSKGPPLTPPARLSDRRFLPSLLKQDGTPNSSMASGLDERPLPQATLGSPAEKKGVLRHQRRATTNSINKSPFSPSPPAAVHFAPHFLRDSGSSYSSGPGGASTTTIGSNKAGSIYSVGRGTPPLPLPLSPTRPPRPHDGHLEIPHLVTPAGPPPNRALPAPPPYHPASPTFSVSPVSPSSSPALPPVRPPPWSDNAPTVSGQQLGADSKVRLDPSAIGIALPASTMDLRDLTESYARETSESWGSWSGAGGGGPGVSIAAGRKRGYGHNGRPRENGGDKKGGSGSTVSLQELDLEKLGGKY